MPSLAYPALGTSCAVVHGAMAAVNILVHCPVSGVGRLNGSLLSCLRKDVRACVTLRPGLGVRGDGQNEVND
ncbi:hypothetical protein [Desulfosporosinus sp. SB140]|uniref:hypothetical protein n=1 Tax=Desulfosporosinus paludis TaxID=3115649 RepID=UPI0038907576